MTARFVTYRHDEGGSGEHGRGLPGDLASGPAPT